MPNQPTQVSRRQLLTPEDLAEFLCVPERTLSKWRSERTGPLFLRVGVHVRYRPEDVDVWVGGLLSEAKEWMSS